MSHRSERGIILAPQGRDAAVAAGLFGDAGLQSAETKSVSELVAELEKGAGFALLTEEALRTADLNALATWLRTQPEWSDFPFVLLTTKGGGLERNPLARRLLEVLGNVTFLERPFHPTTLISLARSALRGRMRQYDARARLEELNRGAERYRSLFESIDAGFCIIEMIFDECGKPRDYRFIEANPAFEKQTGLVGVTGRTIREMLPDHEEEWFNIFGAVARSGEQVRFEQHAEALGNVWYEVYAFRAGDPKSARVAVLFNNISARREMEEALRASEDTLRRLNETLEERVTQRTHALEQAQEALRQSQKLEAMGQLTGGVAHDFNNLLTPIVGSLDLLYRRGLGNDRERSLIEGAIKSADRARTLVQRLLAFARRQPLQARAIDVDTLVRDMESLISSTCGPRVRLKLQISQNVPLAHADANQIEMALLNLVVNARDAMPGGGTLTISLSHDRVGAGEVSGLQGGNYVRLGVADTGTGMDADTIAKAIEPFFTTKGVGQGTGLGLSMVHGVAAQLGGGLRIESTLGKGTSICLWLPVSESALAPEQKTEDQAAPVHRGTVLLVDDEDLVRASTADMLSELGYTVLEAVSGEDALRILEEGGNIDLLVTDHLMPGISGTDLAERVRAWLPQVRVLVVSGYAEGAGLSANVPRLTKPFRQSDLASSLAKL